ncbi:FAD-dependent oxidoreductase [Candidatus Dependentiae bacterium]|nr:FAD-dependent oxidoreductase [Candidatus Dependentiae bacterium]
MYKKRFFFILSLIIIFTAAFFHLSKTHLLKHDIESLNNLKNIVPVAIIGSGPAGSSGAIFSARGLYHTVVFQGPYPGGQLTRTMRVENWPGTISASGSEIIETIKKQAQNFGAIFSNETITKVDFSSWPFKLWTDSGKQINALTVIIATGGVPKKLNIPGEEEYFGKGVAVCGICDAAFHKGQIVTVVGSGDAAMQEAELLAKFAKKVIIIVGKESPHATAIMKEQIKNIPNIELLLNTMATKIIGDGKTVTQIEIEDNTTKQKKLLDIGAAFVGIGQTPNTKIFKNQVPMNKKGFINVICNTQNTTIDGIYAAGTAVHKKFTKAISGAGDAVKAAISAMNFLEHLELNQFLKEHDSKLYRPLTNDIERIGKGKEFEEKILNSKKASIVIFYSSSCATCNYALSLLDQLSPHFKEKYNFFKIEKKNLQDVAQKYNITSLPSILLFKDGKLELNIEGKITKEELEEFLES